MEDVEKFFSVKYGGWVKEGGEWTPEHCQARKVRIHLISDSPLDSMILSIFAKTSDFIRRSLLVILGSNYSTVSKPL